MTRTGWERGWVRWLGAAVGLVALVLSWPAAAQTNDSEAALQRVLLHDTINARLNLQVGAEVLGTVDLGISTFLGAYSVRCLKSEPKMATTLMVGAGALHAAGLASLLGPRDTRTIVLESVVFAAPAVTSLALALADDPYPAPKLTMASLAAGYLTTGVLTTVSSASRPTRYSTLRAHWRRLADSRELSPGERRQMHHDLLRSADPIPRWLQGTPLLVAGAVAMAPAFNDSYYRDEKTVALLLGAGTILSGLLHLLDGPIERYVSAMEANHLSVAALPGGVSVAGSFSAF